MKPGAPDPSHLGTWQTTHPMRADSERLAAPHVFADNFHTDAHNGSSRKREAQMITAPAPIRAFSLHSPWTLALFIPRFFSQNSYTPTPPTVKPRFWSARFRVNLNKQNILDVPPCSRSSKHKCRFSPLFWPFSRQIWQKIGCFLWIFHGCSKQHLPLVVPIAPADACDRKPRSIALWSVACSAE